MEKQLQILKEIRDELRIIRYALIPEIKISKKTKEKIERIKKEGKFLDAKLLLKKLENV